VKKTEIQNFNYDELDQYILVLRYLILCLYISYLCLPLFRFRKRDIYYLIRLTESFTWEELPTRHPDTGYTTKAEYIPKIPVIVKYTIVFMFVFHTTQSIVRMVHSHDMVFSKWYPFDATVSPVYELANLSQVISKIILLLLKSTGDRYPNST
jgi:hypothetical protein